MVWVGTHQMIKSYLCGPMSGYPEHNIPLFKRVTATLREMKMTIVSPVECLEFDPKHTWADYMKADIRELMGCDSMLLLPGYGESKGATLELLLGVWLDYKIYKLTIIQDEIQLAHVTPNRRQALTLFIGAYLPRFLKEAPYYWDDEPQT